MLANEPRHQQHRTAHHGDAVAHHPVQQSRQRQRGQHLAAAISRQRPAQFRRSHTEAGPHQHHRVDDDHRAGRGDRECNPQSCVAHGLKKTQRFAVVGISALIGRGRILTRRAPIRRPPKPSGCHLDAFHSAFLTSVGTGQHFSVAGSVSAAVRLACAADLGTFAAQMLRVVRAADHEFGADHANLCAIHHDGDVRRIRMMPALLQAMRNGGEAASMAIEASCDACLHGVVSVIHDVIPRDEMSRRENPGIGL